MKYHQRRFLRFYDLNRRYSVYKIHQHDVIVTPVVTQFIVDKMKPITYVFLFHHLYHIVNTGVIQS